MIEMLSRESAQKKHKDGLLRMRVWVKLTGGDIKGAHKLAKPALEAALEREALGESISRPWLKISQAFCAKDVVEHGVVKGVDSKELPSEKSWVEKALEVVGQRLKGAKYALVSATMALAFLSSSPVAVAVAAEKSLDGKDSVQEQALVLEGPPIGGDPPVEPQTSWVQGLTGIKDRIGSISGAQIVDSLVDGAKSITREDIENFKVTLNGLTIPVLVHLAVERIKNALPQSYSYEEFKTEVAGISGRELINSLFEKTINFFAAEEALDLATKGTLSQSSLEQEPKASETKGLGEISPKTLEALTDVLDAKKSQGAPVSVKDVVSVLSKDPHLDIQMAAKELQVENNQTVRDLLSEWKQIDQDMTRQEAGSPSDSPQKSQKLKQKQDSAVDNDPDAVGLMFR